MGKQGTETATIPLDQIVASGDTQPRVQMDVIVAAQYREAMDAGSRFPPVDVFFDGQQYFLADGFHRVYAARKDPPHKTITAVVHEGDKRAAILFAVGANVTHGRPRTNEDKRHAVLLLLQDAVWARWSDRTIARHCKVTHVLVATVRASLEAATSERQYRTKHGTLATMDTTRIGKSAKISPEALTLLSESTLLDDPHAIKRLAGMEPDRQMAIAEAAAAHPEVGQIQKLWSSVNRQENQRRIDNLPDHGSRWTVHQSAAITLLETLAPKSVDVIITDPPYPEQYLTVYEDLSRLAAHVLKDGGLCIVMTGKQHLPTYMQGLAAALTYHWVVPIILTENARVWDRKVFTRWKPLLVYSKGKYDGPMFHDVIHAPTGAEEKTLHHWEQGEELMTAIVQQLSQAADVILDPFCGSGTTGVAALRLNRVFIGNDIDEEAAQTARRRLLAFTESVA